MVTTAVLALLGADAGRRVGRRRPDLALTAATAALVAIGLMFVSLATVGHVSVSAPPVLRQTLAAALGTALAVPLALTDHRRIALLAPVLYGASLLLLTLVVLVGPPINGTRAWLVMGPVRLQPSEVAKVALILVLATSIHERREAALSVRGIGATLLLAGLPIALVLVQPDMGTVGVLLAVTAMALFVAGTRVRHLLALAAVGVVAIAAAWHLDLVAEHQIERVGSFLTAGTPDPQGAGYNSTQAQIAVGAGGLTGGGAHGGAQSALGFVPEHHTDFIFAVVAERAGFVGALVLLGCYAVVLWRGWCIAVAARDPLGRLLAMGVVAVFAVQMLVGVGMTVGLVPVIGLPLPLVSYGGTSVVVSLVMVGLLHSVYRSR